MAYITLTDATFREEVLKSKQPVLVEFLAKWSGPCHIIAPGLREIGNRYRSSVKFCKLDMDSQIDMARQYGVYGVPTILLFRDGQLVDHITGVVPRAVIAQKLDALLEPDTDKRNGEDCQKTP